MNFDLKILFYSDSSLVFIVCCLVCAAVRWFHICGPYQSQEKLFYPARKQVTVAFLMMGLLQVPYWLNPSDPGAIIYITLANLILYPVCFADLFEVYFRIKAFNKLIYRGASLLAGLVLAALFLLAVIGGTSSFSAPSGSILATHAQAALAAGAVFALLLDILFLSIVLRIRHIIDNFHLQNYSDDKDFPLAFARKIFWLPFIWIIFIWVIYFTGNMTIKAISDLIFSVMMVGFLCLILHPQRYLGSEQKGAFLKGSNEMINEQFENLGLSFEEIEQRSDAADSWAEDQIDPEAKAQVLEIILRRFREPHLQKNEVLAEVSKGKVTAANRYITSVGYYNLINMFRLEYSRLYTEANPMVKQSTAAKIAGFSSGSSYSKAKKSIRKIDSQIVSRLSQIIDLS